MAMFAAKGVEIIGLIPHRTDIIAYHQIASTLTAKCEWRGRLNHLRGVADRKQLMLLGGANDVLPVAHYDGVGQSAPFPSVLPYWGKRPKLFAEAFEGAGAIWCPL